MSNSRTEHIFVVLRWDSGQMEMMESNDIPSYITGTRAFGTDEEAEAEVARLNQLNSAKGCRYFSVLARLTRRDEDDDGVRTAETP
jgi:hypothetical protein